MTPAQADEHPPGLDTAQRDDEVPEVEEVPDVQETGEGVPGIDTAQRDDVVLEDWEDDVSGTEGGLPGVDTAQRDDVIPEDVVPEHGAGDMSGTGGGLPGVDTAQRDDVVVEDVVPDDISGTGGGLPGVDTAQRDDVVVEDVVVEDVVPEDWEGDMSGTEGRLPGVDTAQRGDVVVEDVGPEDWEGDMSGTGGGLPGVDTARRGDLVNESEVPGAEGMAPALYGQSDSGGSVIRWPSAPGTDHYLIEIPAKGYLFGVPGDRSSFRVSSVIIAGLQRHQVARVWKCRASGPCGPQMGTSLLDRPSWPLLGGVLTDSGLHLVTWLPVKPPPSPKDLTAKATSGKVTLSWTDSGDPTVTGYQILRRRPDHGEGRTFVHVHDTGGAQTEYADTTVQPDTLYEYRVKAINGAGVGPRSNSVQITTGPSP